MYRAIIIIMYGGNFEKAIGVKNIRDAENKLESIVPELKPIKLEKYDFIYEIDDTTIILSEINCE